MLIIDTFSKLAMIYNDQEKYNMAVLLETHVLAKKQMIYGHVHFFVANSLTLLGQFRYKQNKFDISFDLFRKAFLIYNQFFGANSYPVMCSMMDIANVLNNRKEFDASENIYRRCLTYIPMYTGENHARFSCVLVNLANVLVLKSEFDEAENMYKRALVIDRKV
jgi:tetratricopeptide (TPR) repeat protein